MWHLVLQARVAFCGIRREMYSVHLMLLMGLRANCAEDAEHSFTLF